MRCLMASVVLVGLGIGESSAADAPTRQPAGIGQLLVGEPQSGAAVGLDLAHYHVHVTLRPPVALVQVDQSFINHTDIAREGTYVFNLPDGAAVSRFALFKMHTQLIEGELIARSHAASVQQAIGWQRDWDHRDKLGNNLFRMRVLPIPAHDTQRILFDFTVPLVDSALVGGTPGRYTFELPLASDLEPIGDFAITGEIKGPTVAGTAVCSSHPDAKFDASDEDALRFELRQTGFGDSKPFRVQFEQRQTDAVTVRSFFPPPPAPTSDAASAVKADAQQEEHNQPERGCEFLVSVSPEALHQDGPPADSKATPVDVLILADTSSANRHRTALRHAVRAIADSLRDVDRFQLGCVDADYRPLIKEWIAPRSDVAEQLWKAFAAEFFLGGDDFKKSFKHAFESLPAAEAGRRRWVIYVGDGTLAADNARPLDIHRDVAPAVGENVRFAGAILGDDAAGRLLMEKLASTTGGRVFRSGRSANETALLDWTARGFPEPVKIVEIHADGVADEDLFTAPSWIPGSALMVCGRRQAPEEFQLKLTIERNGAREPLEWTLEAADDADDLLIGRLWAQHKIEQLDALAPSAKQDAAAVYTRRLALCQEWTLLDQSTAFVALDRDADYEKYGARRALRHKYWKTDETDAVEALPAAVAKSLSRHPPQPESSPTEEFDAALAAAREALKHNAPGRALSALHGVEKSSLAEKSSEFTDLRDNAQKLLARAELLTALGPQRGWFDRTRPIGMPTPTSDLVWQFNYGYGPAGAAPGSFTKQGRAPNALSKRVAPPEPELTLVEFANWVRETSGLSVVLDEARFDDGTSRDDTVDLRGVKLMSLQNVLENVLPALDLTAVAGDGVLTITGTASAAAPLETRIYPIRDLILSTEPTAMSLLADAQLDLHLDSQRRLEARLDQKISVEFSDTPLEEALASVFKDVDDNYRIDRRTIADEGVDLDQPVTLELKDAPIRRIFRELLEPLQLRMNVEHEAINITTDPGTSSEKLTTRIHSARGIIHAVPKDLKQMPPRPKKEAGTWASLRARRRPAKASGGDGEADDSDDAGLIDDTVGRLSQVRHVAAVSENLEYGDANAPSRPREPAEAQRASAAAATPPTDAKRADDSKSGSLRPEAASSEITRPDITSSEIPNSETTDARELVDIITGSVQPETWETLSGPGSLIYAPGIPGFIVSQTKTVHDELAAFLLELRALPLAMGEQSGRQLATPKLVGANDLANWNVRGLVNLLTSALEPRSWEDLSGPGSVSVNSSRLALVIRQTPQVHLEIRSLLTALRRARYLARRGAAWNSFDVETGPDFPMALGVTELASALAKTDWEKVEPQELKALEVLAEPVAGVFVWRSLPAAGGSAEATTLRRSAQRSEFEFDGRISRTAGDEAAIAYPGLTLVERGAWGPELRKIVDGRLPWLPHRTRRELAEMFAVTVVSQNQQTAQLKFAVLEGAAGDEIAVTVDRKNGLPTLWETKLAGQTMLRLRFADQRQAKGKPIWTKVTAEDGAGRQLERWELAGFSELKSEIPGLDEGWGNFVVLDVRKQDAAAATPFLKALQSIRGSDREAVDAALSAALAKQPRQPLVSFLKAWNLSQQPDHESQIVALLSDVARNGATDLVRNVVDGAFVHLSAKAIYDVLLLVPEKQRAPALLDHLARMSARAGQSDAAVLHVKSAIAAGGATGESPERARILIELLLAANQRKAAFEVAHRRVKSDNIGGEDIPGLADLFARDRSAPEAQKLLEAALARPGLNDATKRQLLIRLAAAEKGLARWRTLVEAISLLPTDSKERPAPIRRLVSEIQKAKEAGQAGVLAEHTKDVQISAALWLTQAEHEVQQAKPGLAADICWKLYLAKQLPADRFGWFIVQLEAAKQHDRVIALVEERLRSGATVEHDVLHTTLATSYDAAGRKDAAARARSTPAAAALDGGGGGRFR